jgi:hypothetical protein
VSDYARDRCIHVKERTENYPMNMNGCCDEAGEIRHVHVLTNRATDYMYVGMKHDMELSRCVLRLGRQDGPRVCARLSKK